MLATGIPELLKEQWMTIPALSETPPNLEKWHDAGDKNKRRIINTDAGNCQTISWNFRASLAQAGKLCYFLYFLSKDKTPSMSGSDDFECLTEKSLAF